MNSNDLDRNLNEWFDAVEPRNEPQQILTNVFAVTRRTGQRRGIAGRLATILPLERVLNATFEGMRKRRQHVGGRTLPGRLSVPRFVTALGGAAAVLIVAVVAFGLYVNQPGISGLATPSPAAQSPAAQQPSPSPSIKPTISGSMWPQSTLEEVQAAQELAD